VLPTNTGTVSGKSVLVLAKTMLHVSHGAVIVLHLLLLARQSAISWIQSAILTYINLTEENADCISHRVK
jgi:hypothetical protein